MKQNGLMKRILKKREGKNKKRNRQLCVGKTENIFTTLLSVFTTS